MQIVSRYNLRDNVWIMVENRPKEIKVDKIHIVVDVTPFQTDRIDIRYTFIGFAGSLLESELFESKEALIQSL